MGVLVEDLLTLARLDEVRDAGDRRGRPRRAGRRRRGGRAGDGPRPAHRGVGATRPPSSLGDADQLRQVLANLLRNALVHTPPGTPVEIDRRAPGAERGDARGARPRARACRPTARTRSSSASGARRRGRERGRAGAGLGLAIVAGIVEGHGGCVRAANAAGGGAVFTVTLPGAPEASAPPAPAAPRRCSGAAAPRSASVPRLLPGGSSETLRPGADAASHVDDDPRPVAPRRRARRLSASPRRPPARRSPLPRPELAGLLVLAAVLNLWALGTQRLGEHVLQRRRALDELELARLPLRVVRPGGRHDGRQAAAGAVGAGAVGARLRLHARGASSCRRR